MKLNILGTEYDLIIRDPKDDPQLTESCDGYTDNTVKEFVVADMNAYQGRDHATKNLKDYEQQVARHEIIHGFLFESGLDVSCSWATNEEVVDWFAIQMPKILKACQEADVI